MGIEYLSEWHDDLIWCPSQLTRKFKNPRTGTIEEVYCRWRHQDPWTFEIISTDPWIYLGSGLSQDNDIADVHKFAEKLLVDYYAKTSTKAAYRPPLPPDKK